MTAEGIRNELFFAMNLCVKLISVLLLTVAAAGCTRNPDGHAGSAEQAAEVHSEKQELWLKDNQLGEYNIGKQDWAAIEADAIREGSLFIYSNLSSVAMVMDSWNDKYPGISLIINNSDDIPAMMMAEQKAGNVYGDIWFSTGDSHVVGNMLPRRYIWNFVPDTLGGGIPSGYTEPLLITHFRTTVLAYNSELNKTCPVTNIWELIQPEWKGKIYFEDPLTETSVLNMLLTYVSHADELAASYVDLYGSAPVLDSDTPDAGWLWLKRFTQNSPVPLASGEEVGTAFASHGLKDNNLAFISYSAYADVLKGDLIFEPCWDLQPVSGTQSQSYIAIINMAPHPNAAKLFLRFITSEEGRKPWAKFGSYFTDSTYKVPEGQMNFQDILDDTWFIDDQFAYKNMIQALDLYLLNMSVQ